MTTDRPDPGAAVAQSFQPALVRVAVAVTAVLLLAGCSGGPSDPASFRNTPSVTPVAPVEAVADPDRHFIDQQLSMHDQAAEMSKMMLTKKSGADPEVRTLARRIATTSEKEIKTMNAWLTAWGPAAVDEHEPAEEAEPDHHSMDGLMTEGQMELLFYTDGPIKQQVYLEGMVKNHQATVAATGAQVLEGRRPEVVALARTILTRQRSEIATLQALQASS